MGQEKLELIQTWKKFIHKKLDTINFFKRFLLIWLIFLFLCLIIFSYFLPLLSYQEARRVVITQETFLGSLLIPTFNEEPYFTKPPLYTWISLPFYGLGIIFSEEVFFLRFISLGSYVILSCVIYFILKKDPIKTLISLFILFGSFRFLLVIELTLNLFLYFLPH